MARMHYYLGIDVGTGSARAGIFDGHGRLAGSASRAIRMWKSAPDHVEQSSDDIWRACCVATRLALKKSGVPAAAIKGIGFDATCSLVALDEENRPVPVTCVRIGWAARPEAVTHRVPYLSGSNKKAEVALAMTQNGGFEARWAFSGALSHAEPLFLQRGEFLKTLDQLVPTGDSQGRQRKPHLGKFPPRWDFCWRFERSAKFEPLGSTEARKRAGEGARLSCECAAPAPVRRGGQSAGLRPLPCGGRAGFGR